MNDQGERKHHDSGRRSAECGGNEHAGGSPNRDDDEDDFKPLEHHSLKRGSKANSVETRAAEQRPAQPRRLGGERLFLVMQRDDSSAAKDGLAGASASRRGAGAHPTAKSSAGSAEVG